MNATTQPRRDWMIIVLIFISIVILALITSCNPCKRLQRLCPPKIHDSLVYVETVTDDPNYTIPDSLFWQFVLECDSNYSVLVKQLLERNTGLETKIEIKEVIKWKEDGTKVKQLTIDLVAISDSIGSLNRTIEKLKSEVSTIEVPAEVEVYKSRKFFIYGTIGFLCCIISLVVYIVVRFKKAWLKSVLNR